MIDPAITERHLALLDELVEIGMVLARRVRDLPPRPKQDVTRDLDIIARAVRRTILLYNALAAGTLPKPRIETPDRARSDRETLDRERLDWGPRLDSPERLDDISAPFEQTVAAIIRDIKTALAASPFPKAPPRPSPAGTDPDRPEADVAILD